MAAGTLGPMSRDVRDPVLPATPRIQDAADGRGGLVRVTLVGEPHDGRELYIDELDLPAEIWTTPPGCASSGGAPESRRTWSGRRWGQTPAAPPIHYALRIPPDTQEPLFVSDDQVR